MFNPDNRESLEDQINKFMLSLSLMKVEEEHVVCSIFPYTFEGRESTWYFSLTTGSITNCDTFERLFLKTFGDDKTPTTLVLNLSRLRMNPKGKIKYFNQRFMTFLNRIPEDSRPPINILLEFYTTTLPSSIVIFVKRATKTTLDETMQETLEVEMQMMRIPNKALDEERRALPPTRKVMFKE
jgi:hypothetical protein